MNITITVDEVTLDSIIRGYGDEATTVGDQVVHAITARLTRDDGIWPPLRRRFEEIRDEEIREAVRPLIAEALSRPVQQANPYGEPVGKETTLTAIIVAEAQSFMTKKTGTYQNERTVLQALVAEAVQAAFKAEVADAVKQAREAISGEIGKQAGAAVAAAVQRAMKS